MGSGWVSRRKFPSKTEGHPPPTKLRRQSNNDNQKQCLCAEAFSPIFLSSYFLFRTEFHANHPLESKIDYGWYPQLLRQWPEWLISKRAETSLPPSANVLTKLWTAHNDRLQANIRGEPGEPDIFPCFDYKHPLNFSTHKLI